MFTHEVIHYNKNLPMKLFFQKIGDVAKHWHQSMELLLVLQGEAEVIVESEAHRLAEGDIILINPQQIHETHGSGCILAMLQIKLSMFRGTDVQENTRFLCNSSPYQNKERFSSLLRLFARLIEINSTDTPADRTSLLTISCAYHIMHELMLHFYAEEGSVPVHSTDTLQRLKSITSYLDAHYMEDITLKSMASLQFLSSSYLSHFFEKNMNMTFSAYLSNVRLEHATQELLGTDHYIEDIAANNGFPNSRAFVSAFRKRYQTLPSQYRTDARAQKSHSILEDSQKHNYLELEKRDFLKILNQYLDKTSREPFEKPRLTQSLKSHTVPASAKGIPLRHTFRAFTSVGRASDLFKEEIREMLKTQQQDIGYRYLKFHGILDDSMMLYREEADGTPVLSFTYIDKALDFLCSIGLRPLIQFSFMPKALARFPDRQLFANPVIISPPKDEDKWCFLIEALTRHLICRYGLCEVRQWLFTFWNETLSPSPFSLESFELTSRLYSLTYQSVKKCDALLPFGNPALLACHWPNQAFSDFLAFCRKHGCLPDFHLLHFYPISNSYTKDFEKVTREEFTNMKAGDIILSQDPELMHKFIRSYRTFARDFPDTPAYLTEWCSTSSHRDWLNDTCFRSAYICKNILENYDRLDSFGNWTLTDLIEELPVHPDLFHGGMGLFTRNGIKKPAYYAFSFLNQLDDFLLQQEEGYFVTTDGAGNYTILLYNYHHYSGLYAQGILFDASPESRYDVFGDTHSMEAALTLEQVSGHTYQCREQIVNREYGSCYDEWVRMGAEPLTTPQEVALLKARSVPMLLKSILKAKDGRLNYFAHLAAHEIRLVKLNLIPE